MAIQPDETYTRADAAHKAAEAWVLENVKLDDSYDPEWVRDIVYDAFIAGTRLNP